MDELRMHHDEVTVVANRTPISGHKRGKVHSSLPFLGRFLLCLSGHMQFGGGLASQFFAFFSYAILPLAFSVVLLSTADINSKWSFTKSVTLCCFQTGLSLASHSLKSNGFDLLLGPKDHQLDEYAVNADFMPEWQRMSRRRLLQTLGAYAVLAGLVAIVNVLSDAPAPSLTWEGCPVAIFEAAFWLMQFRYLMLCYSLLHVGCGFELALDSFTLSFFKSMKIEDALEEWNILQATLRQVSTKMSDCFRVMGFCCLASVALLAEQVIFYTDEVPLSNKLQWSSRFYPMVIFFLYTMVRAAAVTEKANRVAPLVNSWKFHGEEEDGMMSYGRQYAVQYIIQSRTGFYLSGAQLTFPHVQQIVYYFAAMSFALFSRLIAD